MQSLYVSLCLYFFKAGSVHEFAPKSHHRKPTACSTLERFEVSMQGLPCTCTSCLASRIPSSTRDVGPRSLRAGVTSYQEGGKTVIFIEYFIEFNQILHEFMICLEYFVITVHIAFLAFLCPGWLLLWGPRHHWGELINDLQSMMNPDDSW